ncbi:hypothetical protein HMPREF1861_00217 [Corynebacterium kroppenstedtii]|nr:hypothetical protein HMPREF1861_00217 [Corynebacterium kroppenstedtii]
MPPFVWATAPTSFPRSDRLPAVSPGLLALSLITLINGTLAGRK